MTFVKLHILYISMFHQTFKRNFTKKSSFHSDGLTVHNFDLSRHRSRRHLSTATSSTFKYMLLAHSYLTLAEFSRCPKLSQRNEWRFLSPYFEGLGFLKTNLVNHLGLPWFWVPDGERPWEYILPATLFTG